MAKRLHLQSEEEHKECEQLVLKNKNENTACSTNTWVNHFENWRIVQGLPLPLQEIRHEDLDETLLISSDSSSTAKQGATSSTTDMRFPSLYSSPAGTSSHHCSPVSYSFNMSYCLAFYPPQPTPHNQFICVLRLDPSALHWKQYYHNSAVVICIYPHNQ